jgi:hypothetical protein
MELKLAFYIAQWGVIVDMLTANVI